MEQRSIIAISMGMLMGMGEKEVKASVKFIVHNTVMSNQDLQNFSYSLEDIITVIISTKDRWVDLERALISLQKQTLKHKVIVMDDNSIDGTASNVIKLFPEVKVISFNESRGYIVRRNEAIEFSDTPYVLSIDDDCTLENPNIIREIASFCVRTNCAAVAWPYIDVSVSDSVRDLAPTEDLWQTFTFKGCSFIVSRKHFLQLGGFRQCFIHQGEEEDFCLRLLNSGFPVLLGNGNAIYHHESPKRSWERMDFYGSRNIILFALFNVPLVFLPIQLIASAIKCFVYGLKIKRPYNKTRGILYGLADGWKLYFRERRAVSVANYMKFRKLKIKYLKVSPIE